MLPKINIVWLKRDLRLTDHEPLLEASRSDIPCMILYIFEPDLINADEYDKRHWRFVWESIQEMNHYLINGQVTVKYGDPLKVFQEIQHSFSIQMLLSHQETGIGITYDRDKRMSIWVLQHGITWQESKTFGVDRGRIDRKGWVKSWYEFMNQPVQAIDLKRLEIISWNNDNVSDDFVESNSNYQPGGLSYARRYLHSFLEGRVSGYSRGLSKPALSRRSCSRLSAYIAWGNISIREVYQKARSADNFKKEQFNYRNFLSRLRWHCHFVQKFEMEERMEFEPINRGFINADLNHNSAHFEAWKSGNTGIPMVDANMRCLIHTGYINFRMRAMLVSFGALHLGLDWKKIATWLASQFLDFEPGIHFPQIQMQAGITGINTVRMYNPIKQGKDHDPEGQFVKKWLPELTSIPEAYIHEPHLMPPITAESISFAIGRDYPQPIIDVEARGKIARDQIWRLQKDPMVRKEAQRILRRHTVPNRKV